MTMTRCVGTVWACRRGLFSAWWKSLKAASRTRHHPSWLHSDSVLTPVCLHTAPVASDVIQTNKATDWLPAAEEKSPSLHLWDGRSELRRRRGQHLAMGSNVSGISTLHRGHPPGFHRLRNSHKGQEPTFTSRLTATRRRLQTGG